MKKHIWQSLDTKDQAAWDTLSDHAKWQILYGNPDPNKHVPPHPLKTDSKVHHRVHETETIQDVDDELFQDAMSDTIDNSTLLINAMKTKTKLQPGDIRRVLSSSQNKPSTTTNREVHNINELRIMCRHTNIRNLVGLLLIVEPMEDLLEPMSVSLLALTAKST